MQNKILKGITQATRLTRAGQLKEATAIIQRTLQGLKEPFTSDEVVPSQETIDVSAKVIDVPENSTPHQFNATEDNQTSDATKGKQTQHPPSDKGLTALWERMRKFKPNLRGIDTIPMPVRTPGVKDKGQFIEGSYGKGSQSRSYKLYIPSGYTGEALPLVVMLHGCTQSADDFAAGTGMNLVAEEELFFVLYPAQKQEANSSKCWNWFKVSDQQRDGGEPSIIAGMTNQIVSTYHLDTSQVYVSGLSAGGAMAAIMGICYPDVYAAVGIHSGLPYGAASDVPSAFAAMQNRGNNLGLGKKHNSPYIKSNTRFVPIIVFHGDRDTTVHPCNSERVISQWALIHSEGNSPRSEETLLRVKVLQEKAKNGHAYTRSIYYDLDGSTIMEQWLVHGSGHAWSGGSSSGSFTDFQGPNASQEMIRFFKEHPQKIK